MAKYNKFWVALLGAILIGLDNFFGISVEYEAEEIYQTVVSLATAFGVWNLKNE